MEQVEKNKEGLTFEEWHAATGEVGSSEKLVEAWKAGVDPAEYHVSAVKTAYEERFSQKNDETGELEQSVLPPVGRLERQRHLAKDIDERNKIPKPELWSGIPQVDPTTEEGLQAQLADAEKRKKAKAAIRQAHIDNECSTGEHVWGEDGRQTTGEHFELGTVVNCRWCHATGVVGVRIVNVP